MLFYFRFREAYYSFSQAALTSLDAVTLLKTALDGQEYGWLKESAAVEQLWRATFMELMTLAENFLENGNLHAQPDQQTRGVWQRCYAAGVERLRKAGIKVKDSGAEEYIALFAEWDPYITRLAPRFAYNLEEIDPAAAKVR